MTLRQMFGLVISFSNSILEMCSSSEWKLYSWFKRCVCYSLPGEDEDDEQQRSETKPAQVKRRQSVFSKLGSGRLKKVYSALYLLSCML